MGYGVDLPTEVGYSYILADETAAPTESKDSGGTKNASSSHFSFLDGIVGGTPVVGVPPKLLLDEVR